MAYEVTLSKSIPESGSLNLYENEYPAFQIRDPLSVLNAN